MPLLVEKSDMIFLKHLNKTILIILTMEFHLKFCCLFCV